MTSSKLNTQFRKSRQWSSYRLSCVRSVQFEDEQGRVFGPYTKMSTSYDLINYKTPNMAPPLPGIFLGADQGLARARKVSRQWKYRIEWFPHSGDPVKSVIMITSRNNYIGDPGEARDQVATMGVTVSSWVSTRQWPAPTSSQFPYIQVFAKLTLVGTQSPVVNASVTVGVEIQTNNGTLLGMSQRLMSDNGSGDEDIIAGP